MRWPGGRGSVHPGAVPAALGIRLGVAGSHATSLFVLAAWRAGPVGAVSTQAATGLQVTWGDGSRELLRSASSCLGLADGRAAAQGHLAGGFLPGSPHKEQEIGHDRAGVLPTPTLGVVGAGPLPDVSG
jgi:hypothetical protein